MCRCIVRIVIFIICASRMGTSTSHQSRKPSGTRPGLSLFYSIARLANDDSFVLFAYVNGRAHGVIMQFRGKTELLRIIAIENSIKHFSISKYAYSLIEAYHLPNFLISLLLFKFVWKLLIQLFCPNKITVSFVPLANLQSEFKWHLNKQI